MRSSLIKSFVIGATLLTSGTLNLAAHAAESVVDYYKQIQQQLGKDDIPYTLHKNGTQWGVTVPDDFVANLAELIVDEKNGYIYILDEGTGGGSGEVQFALFRGEGNSPFITRVESSYMGSQADESKPFFYAYDGHEWYERNRPLQGFPSIDFADFLQENMSIADATALKQLSPQYAAIYYKLPRYGTTTQVWLAIHDYDYAPLCNGSHTDKPNAEAIARYCSKLKGKIYYKIDLPWSKVHNRFTMGQKHREMPMW